MPLLTQEKNMKHKPFNIVVLSLLALLLTSITSTLADNSVTLVWNQHPDPEVTGNLVYYGNTSRSYSYCTNVGNVTKATVTGLKAGTYYFAVTAVNIEGLESDFSNEVSTYLAEDGVDIRSLYATNYTITNVTFVTPTVTTNSTNFVLTATIDVIQTNWLYRMIVTNGYDVYITGARSFRTIPPSPPSQIRIEVRIIQTASLVNPTWKEVMIASVLKDCHTNGIGYYKAVMNTALVTEHTPEMDIPIPPSPVAASYDPEEQPSVLRIPGSNGSSQRNVPQ
jgi:hypothetical protein